MISYIKRVGKMKVELTSLGWQIIYTPNQFINPEMWGKSVNGKVYKSYDDAMHDLDKWAE